MHVMATPSKSDKEQYHISKIVYVPAFLGHIKHHLGLENLLAAAVCSCPPQHWLTAP